MREEMNIYLLEKLLSELYNFSNFDDYCKNGLQVEGAPEVNKVLLAVSFNLKVIESAREKKADTIIVHHGIFGKGYFSLTGIQRKRVASLLKNNINLIGIHLPMDAHPVLGHNAVLSKLLELEEIERFEVGFIGKNKRKYTVSKIAEIIDKFIFNKTAFSNGLNFKMIGDSAKIPELVTVVSGNSDSYFEESLKAGSQLFISGMISEQTPAICEESSTNLLALGHYFSEIPGILTLSEYLINNYNLDCNVEIIPNSI
jgi:dinuclear metal center YbgI/SA1388 family protein